MADHHPVLRHTSPGWMALLPGFIPALLFMAVYGTRRSYELFQAIAASSRDAETQVVTALHAHRDQIILGIALIVIIGALLVWAARQSQRHRMPTGAE